MAERFQVDELAPLGDGIHHGPSGRIYIDRTLPGDVVEAEVHESSGSIVRGDVTRLLEKSPHRVEPPCPHYDVCGGCTLQHAREDFYRAWKVGMVRQALARQNIVPAEWLPPAFLTDSRRRRATFAALKLKNRVAIGYHPRRSHRLTEIVSCMIAEPAVMALRARLAEVLVPILREAKPADVFVQVVGRQSEVVITGAIGKKGRPDLHVHEAAASAAEALALNRLAWRAREQDKPEVLVERAPLIASFGTVNVALPPLAFLQPTAAGEQALVDTVMSFLPASGTFADLFAGCGTFAGAMLARGRVDAFESAEPAVRALDMAKDSRPLRAIQRNLFTRPLQAGECNGYDAIVFDPPRAGAEAQVCALAGGMVPRIVGISCNPITFARDARILVAGGYRLEALRVVDQFAMSHHVELVGSFSKP